MAKACALSLAVTLFLSACVPALAPTPAPVPTAAPVTMLSPVAEPAPTPTTPLPGSGWEVTVWAPYVTILEQMTLAENADLIGEVNFFWYELGADGGIQGGIQSSQGLQTAREAGLRVVPSIVNGGFDRQRVAAVLHDPARRAQHIEEIVALVLDNGFDGIDIDYESLYAEDREVFSLFIEELAAALHAHGKLLSIAVHAKTADPGTWGGQQAQDWARLGAAVDEFKIMTYDFHNGASQAGPIAPLDWVDEVLRYAVSHVPPQKIYVGVPFYGYSWTGATGKSLNWRQAVQLAENNGAEIRRDESGEAWFSYGDGRHSVYFADAEGVAVRLRSVLAGYPYLAGIAIWSLGGEDPGNWAAIRARLSGSPGAPMRDKCYEDPECD